MGLNEPLTTIWALAERAESRITWIDSFVTYASGTTRRHGNLLSHVDPRTQTRYDAIVGVVGSPLRSRISRSRPPSFQWIVSFRPLAAPNLRPS